MSDEVPSAPPAPSTPAPAPQAPAPTPERQVGFSPEYVKDLRDENKGVRLQAKELQQRAEAAEADAAQARQEAADALAAKDAEFTQRQTEIETKAQQRLIHAEAKAAAIKAGMIDMDGLKLADLSAITVNGDGEIEGADALVAALKEAKPYLFGQPTPGSSNPIPAPKPATPNGKAAMQLSPEEWKSKLRDIDSGRSVIR